MQGANRNAIVSSSTLTLKNHNTCSSADISSDTALSLADHQQEKSDSSGESYQITHLLSSLPANCNNEDNTAVCGGVYEHILSESIPDLCLELIDMGGILDEFRRRNRGRAATAPEVLEELMHPDVVSVPMTQLDAELELITEIKKCNQQRGSRVITLDISGTIFYMSLMHYQGDNLSVPIYNDVKQKRIEFLDFTRRSDDQLLYLWDSRQAIVLSLLNDNNVFESRLFIAMTNLYLPFGDAAGTINQEFVLLDILARMDAHTFIDALVGVIATGEVRLGKYSKDHLRFLYCDFQFPLQRGEDYWIAKRNEFYNDRGLYYDPARRIPRDPDISNLNRIYNINKQYLKDYPRTYVGKGCGAKQRENFEKWRLLPGKNKTTEEENENIISLLNRAKSVHNKKVSDADAKLAAELVVEEQKKQASAKRAETRKLNAASKAAEVAEAIAKVAVAEAKIPRDAQLKAPSVAVPGKADENEDSVDNHAKAAVGNKRIKSKSSTTGNVQSSGSEGGAIPRSTEQITVIPTCGPSTAASTQVLTIVFDTSSSTSSSSLQVSAVADKHANELLDAYKVEQAKQIIQRQKDIDEQKQREHAFAMQQQRDELALKAQRHETQIQINQRKLDIANQRDQIAHDQQSRFYQQLRQQADKNSHNTAISKETAAAEVDIQRDQFNLRKDIQEWEDRRSAKQAAEFRRNMEHDSQVAWQREDALRRQSAQNSWYNAELANAPAPPPPPRRRQPSLEGGQKQEVRRQGYEDEVAGKKRMRDDDGNSDGGGDGGGDDVDQGGDDDENFLYISKPFKPSKTTSNTRL